jgi:hypothetical protein
MQDDLVAIASRATTIEVGAQRGLGKEAKRVRASLCRRHLIADPIARRGVRRFVEQAVGCRLECALNDRAERWRQPASNDDHPIVVDMHHHGPGLMPSLCLFCGLEAIDTPPRPDDALDLRSRAGEGQVNELSFVVGRGDPRESTHLGVRERPTLHRDADERKGCQRTGDANFLTRCAEIDFCPPMEPVRAREEAVVPAGARIEFAKHDEQLIGGRMQTRGERGNSLAEMSDVALSIANGRRKWITSGLGRDER